MDKDSYEAGPKSFVAAMDEIAKFIEEVRTMEDEALATNVISSVSSYLAGSMSREEAVKQIFGIDNLTELEQKGKGL